MKIKQKIYNLLRKSQKYTKTDMVYLAKGGFWLTVGKIVSTIASFLSAIAFANLLPREVYGQYKYILSVASILAIPTLSGMNTAVTQAVARGYEGSFIPALKTRIKWGLLGGLASLGLAGYYYFQDNITLTFCFLIAAIFLPFMDSLNIYGSFLEGKKRFDVSAKFTIFIRIISLGAMISVLFLTNNVFLILFTYFISHTLLRFVFLKITLRKFKLNKKQDHETIPFGKHLSLIQIIGTIANQIDKIILWHFLGATYLAIYSFSTLPVKQIKSFLKPIYPLALPKLVRQNRSILKKTLPGKIFKFTAALFLLILIYIIIAPYVYKLFFPEYISSAAYSQLYVFSLIFYPLGMIGIFFVAIKREKPLYIVNITTSITRIILLIILIPVYGIPGAIVALLASQFINTCALYYFFKKEK